jgi:AcrR family transcriptional regulator
MNLSTRSYNNEKRALKANKTKVRIMQSFTDLWNKHSLNEITLEWLAEESGVTTRTILRKFGSKEKLLEETLLYHSPKILETRKKGFDGNIDKALKALLANYESMGDAVIRTIKLESELDIARKIGETGRKVHRDWCKNIFGAHLPPEDSTHYERDLAAFIAATEIYLWKLLRRDLGFSEEECLAVFKRMVDGLILQSTK